MKFNEKHILYGRRILHVLSPVRWSGQTFQHSADSNYRVAEKTINWLPMCHHYVLIPESNDITGKSKEFVGNDLTIGNITYIKHPYPASVLYNRSFFDSKSFLKYVQSHIREIDIDFIFIHQPELLYNVEAALQVARIGPCLKKFTFFHWVDCQKSRPIEDYPEGYLRQLEGMTLSDKVFMHCESALDYMESNWKHEQVTLGLNRDYLSKKVTWMPLSSTFQQKVVIAKEIHLPKKRILVFNHRWNSSTGTEKLIKFTESLDRNKYLVWVTDKEAKHPKSGAPAPDWMHVEGLAFEEYGYLLKHCFATLTFVDDYATWNMSVQDGLLLGAPSLIYKHPVMTHIIGNENYPLFFTKKDEFEKLLDNIDDCNSPSLYQVKMPNHDAIFQKNLYDAMIENLHVMKQEPSGAREWIHHVNNLNGRGYKRHLLYNTHPNLHAGNSWERCRTWCLNQGLVDDPNSKFTRLSIPKHKESEILKLLDGYTFPETKTDPNFVTSMNNQWW